jgi:hypothetical protein
MADREDMRGAYEALAVEAKHVFVAELLEHLATHGMTQKQVADATGYAAVSVSEFLRQPDRTPENFIRMVSLSVPALAGEYIRFRAGVDAPFYVAAEDAAAGLKRVADVLGKQAKILHALDQAEASIKELRGRLVDAG